MQKLSVPSAPTFGTVGFMMAPSGRAVSPSALPKGSSDSLRTVAQFTILAMASESSGLMGSPSKKLVWCSGSLASILPRNLIRGAHIAGDLRFSVGSRVTTLSRALDSKGSLTRAVVVAPSAGSAKNMSAALSVLLAARVSTPELTFCHPQSDPVDREFTDAPSTYLDGSTRLGPVDSAIRGRHRRSVHQGVFGGRIRRRRGRRAGWVSTMRRAIDRLLGRKPLRGKHRAIAALTPVRQPASITSSAQQPTEGMTS